MHACDAVYVYKTSNEGDSSEGMRHKITEAKEIGLEISEMRGLENPPKEFFRGRFDHLPCDENISNNLNFDSCLLRKRVYVCTHLRGKVFDINNNEIFFHRLSIEEKNQD